MRKSSIYNSKMKYYFTVQSGKIKKSAADQVLVRTGSKGMCRHCLFLGGLYMCEGQVQDYHSSICNSWKVVNKFSLLGSGWVSSSIFIKWNSQMYLNLTVSIDINMKYILKIQCEVKISQVSEFKQLKSNEILKKT